MLADAGYGLSASFRQGLRDRGLSFAVGIPKHLKVYPVDVALVFPVARRGRPRKNPVSDQLSLAAEAMLADADWSELSWRHGTKGPFKAKFAAKRIRIADGPSHNPHGSGDVPIATIHCQENGNNSARVVLGAFASVAVFDADFVAFLAASAGLGFDDDQRLVTWIGDAVGDGLWHHNRLACSQPHL